MNYRRRGTSDGRSIVTDDCQRPNELYHRIPQIQPQFRLNPLLHCQTFQRPYTLNDSLPSATTFMNSSVQLLEWMPRIAPASTHIPPISLVYSSPVIVDVPSDSMPLDLTMSRHNFYVSQHTFCEAAIDMSVMAGRGRPSMQHEESLPSVQGPLTSDVMLEILPSGASEEFAPSGKRKKSKASKCGGNTRTRRKRGGKIQQKMQKQQPAKLTTLAGSCLSPTRTMEAVEGLLMLPESSSPSSAAVSGAGQVSTPKRPKTPRKSRKPMNYRPIDYLTQSRNPEEASAAAALPSEFAINRIYDHAATELEGKTISSGTAITFESTLSQFCRLLESSRCLTPTGSVSLQKSQPVASCVMVTATETQTSPAHNSSRPPAPLRAVRSPQSSESKATETLVSTAESGCQTDDGFGAIRLDHILNPSLSSTWTTEEAEADLASGVRSPLPANVSFSGEFESLSSLDLPQMKALILRLQRRVEMLEQVTGDGLSAEHLLPLDSFGSEPLFNSTAVVTSREPEEDCPPHETSESEDSLHLRLSESDDFVDLEQQLPDSCHDSPVSDHFPPAIDSTPLDTESGEKSHDFAVSGKIRDLKCQLKAIENRFISVEARDEERNSYNAFQGDSDSVGRETDGSISVTSCHASDKQNLGVMSSASLVAEDIICVDEKSDAGMIRLLEANDYEFQRSATVTQQNSELSTVMDQMASLDISKGYVLNNYQSTLQLEAISPPSSVISLHDDETGEMDLNLENDFVIIAHESENNTEGISDVSDGHSGQSNCREIASISASTPLEENNFSEVILSSSTCVSDNIDIGKIVSAESNISDGASVGSSLRVDVADTSTDVVICDVSDINDIAPDRVFQTDTDVLDTVKEINRSHEMPVEVDDMDDAEEERANDKTECSDSVERDNPKDEFLLLHVSTASSENELASRCIQPVAVLSDSIESSVDASETQRAAGDTCCTHDANDCLTVETFSEEVTIGVDKPQLLSEGHRTENVVSDLSSGACGTLLDARVVIKRLNLDAIFEMKTKVRDYKPVIAQWLHKPRRPRRRCRKAKSKGRHVQRPRHCDHNYVQPALDECLTIVDSSEVSKHILQNVEVVAVQQNNELSTSVEPHDIRPHDVELAMTLPLSFNSGLSVKRIDYSGAAVSSSSDVEQGPRLHQNDSTVQENSANDVDTEVQINFTSNIEVISKEDPERDYECADSFSARCAESSVAMAVINGVVVSVDDGCQAPQHEPNIDCTSATFGNCHKSVLDILTTDAATVESNDLIGSPGAFVCTDQLRASNVPRVLDRGINKVVKKLKTISQEVKKLSGIRESTTFDSQQITATHFPSYPEDKKALKARFREPPVQSLALGGSDIGLYRRTDGECGPAEDLPNVAGPDLGDGKEIALEHDIDGSGAVHLSGSGISGCKERTEEMPNTSSDIDNSADRLKSLVVNAGGDWPNEENVEADIAGGNPLPADDTNASDPPDNMNMNLSDHVNDSINMGIVASQNVPRKHGRKPKARQSCSVPNDDCKDTALPHGASKAFDEYEDRGGIMASKSIQRKRRGRPCSSHFFSSSDDSSTRAEQMTKYDMSQAVETVKPNEEHRTSKHSRNLFSEISSSNAVSEEQLSSSVCFDFSLRNSEAEQDICSKGPIGRRMGRPPKRQLNPKEEDSSNQRSEFMSQSEKQVRNKKKSWRLDDQDAKQQQYSPRKRSINGSKTSEISCRKYKTKTFQGQYASDGKQLALNTIGDEDQKYTRQEIPLLKTMNSTSEVVTRKMHVNICRGKTTMVVDVISKTASEAPAGSRLAQCLFCEFLAPNIKDIGEHLDDCHSEFVLVISKVRANQESSVRYFCRHCQFVTVDHTVMWIHFEISHNIRGILTSENHADSDLGSHEPEVQPLSLDQLVHFDRVYMCPECGNLTENRKAMISHVIRCRSTENYCNGNFIKSIALTKPRNLCKQPTYHSLVMDDAFSVYRKPCYICVFCQFVVFEARLALSHFICFHVKKKLLMVCMKDSCGQRFVKERRFYEHMKLSHKLLDLGVYFDCSVTLLEDSALSGEIAEVVLPTVRNGGRQRTSPSHS